MNEVFASVIQVVCALVSLGCVVLAVTAWRHQEWGRGVVPFLVGVIALGAVIFDWVPSAATKLLRERVLQQLVWFADDAQAIRDAMQDMQGHVEAQRRELLATQDTVELQHRRLEDVAAQVSEIVEGQKLEVFQEGATRAMEVVEHLEGVSTVYCYLQHVPIPQTVEVRFGRWAQPPSVYSIHRNIVMAVWENASEALRDYPIHISYIADYSKADVVLSPDVDREDLPGATAGVEVVEDLPGESAATPSESGQSVEEPADAPVDASTSDSSSPTMGTI